MLEQIIETRSRLIAKIVREILRTESFDCLADLTEALKTRLGLLKIRWTNDEISDAFSLIETNTPLLRPPPVARVRPRFKPAPPIPVRRDEAAEILARLGITVPWQSMPDVRELTPDELRRRQWKADQRKAYEMIEQEILDSDQRCEALERKARLTLVKP